MALLLRTCVVGEMLPGEPKRRDGGDESHDATNEPPNIVSFEMELAIFEQGLRICGLVRNDGTGHVDHVGQSTGSPVLRWQVTKLRRVVRLSSC